MAKEVRIPGLDPLTPTTVPQAGWLFPFWNPEDDTTYKVDLYKDLGLALFSEFPTPADYFKLGQPAFATAAEAMAWILTNWASGGANAGVPARVFRTLAQAKDLITNSKVTPGQPYLIDFGILSPSIYTRLVLLDGGEDSHNFAHIGELVVNGEGKGLVSVDIVAGTITPYIVSSVRAPKYDEFTATVDGAQDIVINDATFVWFVGRVQSDGILAMLNKKYSWAFSNGKLSLKQLVNVKAFDIFEIVHNGTGIEQGVIPPAPSGWLYPNKNNFLADAIALDDYMVDGEALFTSFNARLLLDTVGKEIEFEQYSTSDDNSFIAIFDGSNYIAAAKPQNLRVVETRNITAINSGQKIVELLTSSQSANYQTPNQDRDGTWIKRLRVLDDSNAKLLVPNKQYDVVMVVFGDSITVSKTTENPAKDGWIPKLQNQLPDTWLVVSNGFGYCDIADALENALAIDLFVRRFAWASRNGIRKILYIEPFVNAYRNNKSIDNIVNNILPNTVAAVVAAVPEVEIYLQTPLLWTEGQANDAPYPYTLKQMRERLTAYALASPTPINIVQGPQLEPNNTMLHPPAPGYSIIANNLLGVFVPPDYSKTPDGDNSSFPTPLDGINQRISIQHTPSDLSDGWGALITWQVGQSTGGYPHVFMGGENNGVSIFRLFNDCATVAIYGNGNVLREFSTGPMPAIGGYVSLALYASPAGVGVITSLGSHEKAGGVVPNGNFDSFTIGCLREAGPIYSRNAKGTPLNFSFFSGPPDIEFLSAATYRHGLLRPDEYNAANCVFFSSGKRLAANSTTMLNLANPADIIELIG